MGLKAIPRQSIYHSISEIRIHLKLLLQGRYITGDRIKKFEKELANYLGVKHAVAVSSARLGLYLMLKELNLKKGSEVIIPSYTFHIVPNIVQMMGLVPIFVDCEPGSNNVDPKDVAKAITPRTSLIIPTHIMGNPCRIKEIIKIAKKKRKKGKPILVIEDCAHALGAEVDGKAVGGFGDLGYFSLGMGKNIDCFGGGIITTNDAEVAKKLRKQIISLPKPGIFRLIKNIILSYGAFILTIPWIFTFTIFPILYLFGKLDFAKKDIAHDLLKEEEKLLECFPKDYYFRFANIQAAVGLSMLRKLDVINKIKLKNAMVLRNALSKLNPEKINVPRVQSKKNDKNLFLVCCFTSRIRDKIIKALLNKGIDAKAEYMFSCADMPMFKKWQGNCPNARERANTELIIPTGIYLNKKDIRRIINALKSIIEKKSK